MFKKTLPLLLLIAAVIFASCSSSDPLIGEAQSNIKDENYAAAQTAAEKYIQQNPQNPVGYFYKGVAIGQKAESMKSASEATTYYEQMNDAFAKARELASNMDSPPAEIGRINAVKESAWAKEYNAGVNYVKDDSVMQTSDSPLVESTGHLQNATVIAPDSALSWNVLALVQNKRQNYGEAAKAQEKFLTLANDAKANDYLLLGQFYREDNQSEQAIEALERARTKFPDNTQIVETLADAYSDANEPDKAIGIVNDLVKQDPTNAQYHLSLGTQIYQSALKMQNTYNSNVNKLYDLQQKLTKAEGAEQNTIQQQIDSLKKTNADLNQKINSLADRAIEQLQATIKYRQDDDVAYNTLGIIYQNKAANILAERNLTTDNKMAVELDTKAKAVLQKAMKNYEMAAQIKPDNTEYWKSLFQIYTELGMDKKAAEAEKKAGMQ